MISRNQPYLKFYVKDYLTDEKIKKCNDIALAVYPFLLCILHRSKKYGCLILDKNDRIHPENIKNFAEVITSHTHFRLEKSLEALVELLDKDVIQIEGLELSQHGMIKKAKRSEINSINGSKGGQSRIKNEGFKVPENTATEHKPTEFSKDISDSYFQQYSTQQNWLEVTGSQFRLPIAGILQKLRSFIDECNIKGILEAKSDKDFRTHFVNWLRKQPEIVKNEIKITTKRNG
jgi:hypothetical protein